MSNKLDPIVRGVERLESRISKLDSEMEKQSAAVRKMKDGSVLFQPEDVANACGVMDSGPGNLIGETRNGRRSTGEKGSVAERDAAKAERRSRSTMGGRLYTAFCLTYAALMAAAFMDLLPVFEWERMDLDAILAVSDFLAGNMHIPFILSGIYVVVVFGIQYLLEDSKPFDLKFPLALWSLGLALFSVFGSLRTVPTLAKLGWNRGLLHVVCGDTRYDWLVLEPAGAWTVLFIFSKAPELIDTLFIVLRKRKLITLHWYHHITVLLFCWHSLATLCMNGLIFSSMNLTVHAFMYFFYTLAALGYRPTAFAVYITLLQILQMLVGTAVTVYVNLQQVAAKAEDPSALEAASKDWLNVTWDKFSSRENPETISTCETVHPASAFAGLAMYASYLWLFSAFFYYAYMAPRPKAKVE